ncbi:MAG: hypothetical protein LQ351_002360 [Letrouitia transgressa]|nr:MAG: hypothetical protein LQ351_002360 [Letrouitia transgressa]
MLSVLSPRTPHSQHAACSVEFTQIPETVCRQINHNPILQYSTCISTPLRRSYQLFPRVQAYIPSPRNSPDPAPLEPSTTTTATATATAARDSFSSSSLLEEQEEDPSSPTIRLPRALQALYLRPLKRPPTHGLPTATLQLRSYSTRNVEFFADFALRAAYYLRLPARGPVPLPKLTERWTVPRSNFIFKKAQENFERVTRRRLIQIQDGDPEVVGRWLAFLRKHAYYGVGMKANVWEHEEVGGGAGRMEEGLEKVKGEMEGRWAELGRKGGSGSALTPEMAERAFGDLFDGDRLRQNYGVPLSKR